MNGKTAKMIRGRIGNPGETEYQITPGSQRRKFRNPADPSAGGVDTVTIQLDPACGRKKYQNLKRQYQMTRRGDAGATL